MTETWKPVVGHEGYYEVSDQGRLRSVGYIDARGRRRKPREIKQHRAATGHMWVQLRDRRSVSVHRIVLAAFVGPAPFGAEACHGDGDPANNAATNLRWDTRSENQRDRVRHGTHHNTRKSHCPQGHPYSATNTYRYPDGRRKCRACEKSRYHARKETAA